MKFVWQISYPPCKWGESRQLFPPKKSLLFWPCALVLPATFRTNKMWLTGKGSTQNVFAHRFYFCAKRASKIVVPPKEMLLSFSIVWFLTITSQIESSKATQYTPLYEKRKFKRKSSQWWLLMPATSSHLDERQSFNKSSFSTEPAKSRIYIFVVTIWTSLKVKRHD